jgi:hypothetical protein
MSKLLSTLVAAVFAATSFGAFAQAPASTDTPTAAQKAPKAKKAKKAKKSKKASAKTDAAAPAVK